MNNVDRYLSEEPWDENQDIVYASLCGLFDKYYYETGLVPVKYMSIDTFPTCEMVLREENEDLRVVYMYELINTMKDALTANNYHGIITVDYYDLYGEAIGLFLEKL